MGYDYLKERVPSINHPATQLPAASVLEEALLDGQTSSRRLARPALRQVRRTRLHEEQRRESTRIRAKAFTLYLELQWRETLSCKELDFEMSLHISQLLSRFA